MSTETEIEAAFPNLAGSGYEKIAIYAFVGQFTHAARQLDNGQWTSKLGFREVITHPTLAALSGGIYGNVHCIMRRPIP